MTENDTSKSNPVEGKRASVYANSSYLILLFIIFVSENAFIKCVWFKPMQTIDLFTKICLQILVLIPAFGGLTTRVKMGKKLKAGEISPAYASDLSTGFVSQLSIVYLTFMFLMIFLPH